MFQENASEGNPKYTGDLQIKDTVFYELPWPGRSDCASLTGTHLQINPPLSLLSSFENRKSNKSPLTASGLSSSGM